VPPIKYLEAGAKLYNNGQLPLAAKYLAAAGLNVYDVLNHETLILTMPTVEAITKRLLPHGGGQ